MQRNVQLGLIASTKRELARMERLGVIERLEDHIEGTEIMVAPKTSRERLGSV